MQPIRWNVQPGFEHMIGMAQQFLIPRCEANRISYSQPLRREVHNIDGVVYEIRLTDVIGYCSIMGAAPLRKRVYKEQEISEILMFRYPIATAVGYFTLHTIIGNREGPPLLGERIDPPYGDTEERTMTAVISDGVISESGPLPDWQALKLSALGQEPIERTNDWKEYLERNISPFWYNCDVFEEDTQYYAVGSEYYVFQEFGEITSPTMTSSGGGWSTWENHYSYGATYGYYVDSENYFFVEVTSTVDWAFYSNDSGWPVPFSSGSGVDSYVAKFLWPGGEETTSEWVTTSSSSFGATWTRSDWETNGNVSGFYDMKMYMYPKGNAYKSFMSVKTGGGAVAEHWGGYSGKYWDGDSWVYFSNVDVLGTYTSVQDLTLHAIWNGAYGQMPCGVIQANPFLFWFKLSPPRDMWTRDLIPVLVKRNN